MKKLLIISIFALSCQKEYTCTTQTITVDHKYLKVLSTTKNIEKVNRKKYKEMNNYYSKTTDGNISVEVSTKCY